MATSVHAPRRRLGDFATASLGRHGWLVYLAATALAITAYTQVEALAFKTVIVYCVLGAAVPAVGAGMRIHRPLHMREWAAVLVAVAFWFGGYALWQGYIFAHDGAMPPLSSWRNVLFLALFPLLGGTLMRLTHRREGGVIAYIDTAIVAASVAMIAWIALIHEYAAADELTVGTRVVQIAFALGDVALFAIVLRLLLTPGRRTPSFVCTCAGVFAYLFSDLAWNWGTQLGSYTPGSWGDAGWLAFPAFLGAAALHPSMRELFETADRAPRRLHWGRLAVLVAASVVAPLVVAISAIADDDVPLRMLFVAGMAAVVGTLVLGKLAVTLRDEEALSATLAEQNRELLALDRLKDEFVASVSHELRTPLTSIRGYLELIRDGDAGAVTSEQAQFLGIVDRNAERLLHLVGDLLFVAQVDAGSLNLEHADVDLSELARESVQSARPAAESKGVHLAVDADSPAPLRGDRARLAQLLDNLVSNAVKFTPAGGEVTVRVAQSTDRVVAEVSDTGIGIPPDEQDRLFQRFFRTRAAHEAAIQGTGLGLVIVKAIAEAHGGTVSATSALGEGTTFRVDLPAAEPQAAAIAA